MSTIHSTLYSFICKHSSESTKTSSLLDRSCDIIFIFFFLILPILFPFLNLKISFHMLFFFTMETFDFISESEPHLKLVMTFQFSIYVSSSTFCDEGLYIFFVIRLPSCLLIEQIPLCKLHR